MRSPCKTPLTAKLRHPHRALHRPEVRIGKRNVDGIQLNSMLQLAPVCRNHIGCSWQAGGAPKLRHDLATRKALFSSTRVLRIRKHILLPSAETDSLLK